MHNHFQNGCSVLEAEEGFAKNQQLYINERQSSFGHLAIIQRGLEEIMQAKGYDWISYNCQTFVNRVCFNENKSEAVENWIGGILAGLLLTAGIGALSNSK